MTIIKPLISPSTSLHICQTTNGTRNRSAKAKPIRKRVTKYKAQADVNLQNFVHFVGKARRKVATEISQESETAVNRSIGHG